LVNLSKGVANRCKAEDAISFSISAVFITEASNAASLLTTKPILLSASLVRVSTSFTPASAKVRTSLASFLGTNAPAPSLAQGRYTASVFFTSSIPVTLLITFWNRVGVSAKVTVSTFPTLSKPLIEEA